jgi:tetratricopeptide (TPR) repeat protein
MVLVVACAVTVLPSLRAQQTQQPKQPQPAQQQPKEPTEANPFPDDTNNVPVMPNANTAAPAPAAATAPPPALPSDENDPVRSPDDPLPDMGSNTGNSSSSNSADLQKLLQPPPDEGNRSGKPAVEHTESAKEDESVGNLYLSDHNWRGALSRFESALVLDPENPDVYWGLAECQRHLGQSAAAKANYIKVMEYDPDSRHAKDAKKILKQPEMASVK